MKSFKEFLLEAEQGTYAAVRPDAISAQLLIEFMQSQDIPNLVNFTELHATLLYSRKHLPSYQPDHTIRHEANTIGLEVWPAKSQKRCLVLTLHSPSLVERHKYLMDKHKAIYDFKEFKPHLSLSYDIKDFDIKRIDQSKLPTAITLTNEYKEDLDIEGK